MKIQIGTTNITKNRTWKYLLPCLRAYGEEFADRLTAVFKVAVGIGDMLLIKSGVSYEKHIFVLLDMEKFRNHSVRFLKWIRNQPMYEDDYSFDQVHNGQLQMVVIKLPEECYKPAELFKKSQFSKMYTLEDINRYFADKPETQMILIKDHNYRIEYAKELSRIWETNVVPEELEGELDFPIQKEDEFFNLIKNELSGEES